MESPTTFTELAITHHTGHAHTINLFWKKVLSSDHVMLTCCQRHLDLSRRLLAKELQLGGSSHLVSIVSNPYLQALIQSEMNEGVEDPGNTYEKIFGKDDEDEIYKIVRKLWVNNNKKLTSWISLKQGEVPM